MKLCTINNTFRYELENICRLFFPFEKITVSETDCETDEPGEMKVIAALRELEEDNCGTIVDPENKDDSGGCDAIHKRAGLTVTFTAGDFSRTADAEATHSDMQGFSDECERVLAVLLFNILCEYTGTKPRWGILTGVRPGKLMRRLTEDIGADKASDYFAEKLLCSEEKINLCRTAAENEEKIIATSKPNHFSLYFAIPFCPTRCSYCSFVSHSVERSMNLVGEYVELLCRELAVTGKIAREKGLELSTIYIGGGTPTTLSAEQLDKVLTAVSENFDVEKATEFTVEAGRPDTITADKLNAIKRGGATRISINPQTLNDSVLKVIGRRHTARQTIDAFRLARECGFDNINMDLIAGLPTDTPESFEHTVDGVLALDPESITIHTLSMKRSSRLTVGGDLPDVQQGEMAAQMLHTASDRLREKYAPYYLYRQSKTVGNLENTGWAKPGYEGLYNIFMMDETHTVLACGASGVTKLKTGENTIERIFNYKYPYEYISRYDEIIRRKDGINDFYARYPLA